MNNQKKETLTAKQKAATLQIAQNNMLGGMSALFAKGLGLSSAEPIEQLGVGFSPIRQAWIIPEYDADGKVVGLSQRCDGLAAKYREFNYHKRQYRGTGRGLTYAPNPDFSEDTQQRYAGAKHRHIRVSHHRPCPICGKPDWCVIVENDEGEEISVICGRTETASIKEIEGAGYLHLLKPEGDFSFSGSAVNRFDSDIVFLPEGFADWSVFHSLGMNAIARPSSKILMAKETTALIERMSVKTIIIVGDNDEAGISSVFKLRSALGSYQNLKHHKILAVFPPEEFRDAREWYNKQGFDVTEFMLHVEANAQETPPDGTIEGCSAGELADRFVALNKQDGHPLYRYYKNNWYQYDGSKYALIGADRQMDSVEAMRHQVYEMSGTIRCIGEGYNGPVRNKMSIGLANNVLDMAAGDLAITRTPPYWMTDQPRPNPRHVWSFRNGILDIDAYLQNGEITLLDSTPELFSLHSFDFDFDIDAPCPLADDKVWAILNEDEDCWNLWWEWVAYNTLTDNHMEKFMLMVGKSGYGKGTLLDVMTAIIGYEQMVSTTFKSMCGEFGLSPLVDKLSIQLRDASLGDRSKDAVTAMETIKCITGNDPIVINRKNKIHIPNEKINGKFTFTVNTLPKLPDYARALERRLLLLHFVRDFTEVRDPLLKTKLISEVPGMMKYVLEGLKRIHHKDKFTEPEASTYMRTQFKNITSPMESFLEETCIHGGPVKKVEDQQLFQAWLLWCDEENRTYRGNRDEFRANLLSLSSKIYKNIDSTVKTVAGLTGRYYTRIELNDRWKDKLRGQD